jgi:hypothetical protein
MTKMKKVQEVLQQAKLHDPSQVQQFLQQPSLQAGQMQQRLLQSPMQQILLHGRRLQAGLPGYAISPRSIWVFPETATVSRGSE